MDKFINFNQLYQDRQGKQIYLETKTNTARLVPDSEFRKVNAFHQRIPLAIAIGGLLGYFTENALLGVGIGVVALIFFEYTLRTKVIPSLHVLKKYDIEANQPIRPEVSKNMLLIKMAVYLIAGGLLVYLGLTDSKDQMSQILVVGVGAFSVFLGVKATFEYFNK